MPNNARLLLIDSVQGESLMNFRDVLDATREAFVLHQQEEGRVFPLVRERLPEGIWGIKSGQVVAQNLLGFKSAGFWPGNREKGGEPHQATIVLVDPATGRPQCIIDGNGVTTMRTGAAGGLGLLYLARADSNRVCVFGTGVQARIQLRYALELIPSLHQVDYVSSSGEADLAFERQFSERCTVTPAADRNASVALADIVITATTGRAPGYGRRRTGAPDRRNAVGARAAVPPAGRAAVRPAAGAPHAGRHHHLRHDRHRVAGPHRGAPDLRARAGARRGYQRGLALVKKYLAN